MSIGPWQAMLVLLIVLILFGAGKLPNVMRDLGHGLRNFKKAVHENEEDNALNKTDTSNGKEE